MDKQLVNIQFALFFKNDFKGLFEEISLEIKKQFGSDVNTQILGIPNDMPSDIPRLISKSSLVDINLSKSRIDFFYKNKEFFSQNKTKIFAVVEKLAVEIGRIGVVATYFKEVDVSQIISLLNSSKVNNLKPNEVTIRINDVTEIDGIKTNNSQMYVKGFLSEKDGIKKDGVVITRDINTIADDLSSNNFTDAKAIQFFEAALIKAEETLM